MFDFISKEETRKLVTKFIDELAVRYSYYQMSIQLGVSEKTIYKWRSGNIPKADNFINLQSFHQTLLN